MFAQKPILAIDCGSGSLKLGEFERDAGGFLQLLRFESRGLAEPRAGEGDHERGVAQGLRAFLGESGRRGHLGSACLSGLHVFSRFLKVPAAGTAETDQVIESEARQHVPFPLEQAVWAHRELSRQAGRESEIVLVAVRSELAAEFARTVEEARLPLEVLDPAPAALANAFRYNYGDLAGCSALLDIGARTSNLLVFAGARVFWRTINLGGQAITEGLAGEARMPLAEAEAYKLAEGFVGLGGAYADPEAPRQAVAAKVARQVMTRLHLQVSQTLLAYRNHHNGQVPQRLYLSGGGATMPQVAQFFAEKLGMPVEYFNPFRQVPVAPSVSLEQLAKVAHTLGGVVGLALRQVMRCPWELSLLPPAVEARRQFGRRQAYLAAAVASLVLVTAVGGWVVGRLAAQKRALWLERKPELALQQRRAKQLQVVLARKQRTGQAVEQLSRWMTERFYWVDLLAEVQRALEASEANLRQPGIRPNLWIERMAAEVPEEAVPAEEETPRRPLNLRFLKTYFPELAAQMEAANATGAGPVTGPNWTGSGEPVPAVTNQITTLHLTCRAVSWDQARPGADTELAYTFLKQLQASPHVLGGTNGTRLTGRREADQASGTVSFEVVLVLKTPIKL